MSRDASGSRDWREKPKQSVLWPDRNYNPEPGGGAYQITTRTDGSPWGGKPRDEPPGKG